MDLYPDENLAAFVASIVTYFDELIELIINRGSHKRHHGRDGFEKLCTQQKLIETLLRGVEKLRDPNLSNIYWTPLYTELRIWL
jgi:hypothetical protein